MFDEFFADVKKPSVIKNHTDAQMKRSPFVQKDEEFNSEDDDLDGSPISTMRDGKIDFDELFKRSNKLHSR